MKFLNIHRNRRFCWPNCSFTHSFVGVLISLSFSLLQLCEEQHPNIDSAENCIACICFNKGLNPVQQHNFALAIQFIFACRSVNENENSDHENCDHCLYRNINTIEDCMSMQKTLTNMDTWTRHNNIRFNASKCKALTITRKMTMPIGANAPEAQVHEECHL